MSLTDLALRLFLQIAVILGACYVVGALGRRVGQTLVVAEMIAGILLGPSLLGLLLPGVQQWLFPQSATVTGSGGSVTVTHPSMSILYAISQVGIALYMFLVGLEFEGKLLRGGGKKAGFLAGSSIAVPLILGMTLALWLYRIPGLFGAGISIWVAALFVGSTLAITAFPVLARMLQEFALTTTRLGTLALVTASIDDVSCWCLLAIVLASFNNSLTTALVAIGGGSLYVIAMLTLGRKLLGILAGRVERQQDIIRPALITVLIVLMISSWFTLWIGIYQIFGAFVLGLAIPRGRLVDEIRKQFEPLTAFVLLPTFFAFSGLNTQIGLLNTPARWLIMAIVFSVALIGKAGSCTLAARITGEPWREASAIGVIMNTRGLNELIMLNIGLEEHIITPAFFTIMVLMSIMTTLIASPVFKWMYGRVDPGWKQQFAIQRGSPL